MTPEFTRDDVLEMICKASLRENLGLFIGSGFSKAMLEGNLHHKAYDWKELLLEVCDALHIEKGLLEKGLPYPQVATLMCDAYAKWKQISYDDAENELKYTIAKKVDIPPESDKKEKFQKYFKAFSPYWIVTTNYDSIIEELVSNKHFTLTHNNPFIKLKDYTPIYHIHGSIKDPETIVITNKDYTKTLRTSDYRHERLPFLIKESTVLMVGYSMNDLNVLSAVDYSQNVYVNSLRDYDFPIIQLLHCRNPKQSPYYQKENKIIIQEIDSLENYFDEFYQYNNKFRSTVGKTTKRVNELIQEFANADQKYIWENIIYNNEKRLQIINKVNKLGMENPQIYISYIPVLTIALNKLWNQAQEVNAFEYYEYILGLLLDLMHNIEESNPPDYYIDFLIDNFCKVSPYIGNKSGDSWGAFELWKNRGHEISKNIRAKIEIHLENLKDTYRLSHIIELFDMLDQG